MPDPDPGRRLIDGTVVPRREVQDTVLAGPAPDPFPVGRADLVYLWDEYGTEHLDFAAAAHPFGHRFQPVHDAVTEHMRYYGWTAPPGVHLQRWPVALAERLSAMFTGPDEPPRRVLFCEGERDATRQALALAGACRPGGRPLVLDTGLHTWAAALGARFRRPGSLDGVDWGGVSCLLLSVVDAAHAPVPLVRDWVVQARAHGAPVVVDESVTGLGRTGVTWGQEHAGVVACMTVLGGALGGGLPLGAVVGRADLFPAHLVDPSPRGGHPWACAAGAVVVDTLNPAMLTHADDCGREIAARLAELCQQFPDRLAGHHGVGLLRGLRFRDPAAAARFPLAARGRGLHLAPAVGDTVTIAPVLVSSPNEMLRGVDLIADTVLSWEDDGPAPGQPGVEGR